MRVALQVLGLGALYLALGIMAARGDVSAAVAALAGVVVAETFVALWSREATRSLHRLQLPAGLRMVARDASVLPWLAGREAPELPGLSFV